MRVPPTRLSYLDPSQLGRFIEVIFKNEISRLHTESIVEVLHLEERKHDEQTV